jgi:inorganic triphosphatase YgiF
MSSEVELKLELAPHALHSFETSPWLHELTDRAGKREDVVSVYFDTPKFRLHKSGVSLRVRSIGTRRVQTIKASTHGLGGPLARDEWEDEIGSETPDLSLAKKTPLRPLMSKKLERKLKPVFETSVERFTIPVDLPESRLELSIDRGRITDGKFCRPVNEIEIELKEGDPAGLVEIAERIGREFPVQYGAQTKAERGYALRQGAHVEAIRADHIMLDRQANTGESFKTIAFSCLRHLALNRDAVQEGCSEGVHQMRVGLRRLRAAISIFKNIVEDDRIEQVKTQLRWLTEQLGPARDFDVFVQESVAPLQRMRPDSVDFSPLRTSLEARRADGFARANDAVRSDDYRQMLLKTALWVAGGRWSEDRGPLAVRRRRPVAAFAGEILSLRRRKILKQAKKLASLDARRRHKLRISIKKLRYATEFFESLFPGAKAIVRRKAFGKKLSTLQKALGRLNDISVHERLARDLVHSTQSDTGELAGRKTAFALGFVEGHETTAIDALVSTATKTGAQLKKITCFWE